VRKVECVGSNFDAFTVQLSDKLNVPPSPLTQGGVIAERTRPGFCRVLVDCTERIDRVLTLYQIKFSMSDPSSQGVVRAICAPLISLLLANHSHRLTLLFPLPPALRAGDNASCPFPLRRRHLHVRGRP
jgi:hypothetical protein